MRALIACYATTVWLVAALRFDAAEKRLVRACADDDGGGKSDLRDREQSRR